MAKTYRAVVVTEASDGRCERRIVERPIETLPQGDVLVRVHYSSLNYKDALSATGNKGVTKNYPHTPGIDAAGVVEQSQCQAFRPGDTVVVSGFELGANHAGGFAEYVRVPADWVMPLPNQLSLRQSMVLGTAGLTAALSVHNLVRHGLKPGDGPVLVTGATGGVGCWAVGILSKAGYCVVAETGKPQFTDTLRQLGAKEVISRQEASDTSGKELLKRRWAGGVDTVGGNILATALKSTRYGGAVTCCGMVAGAQLPVSIFPFILRGVSLLGIDWAFCPMDVRQKLWDAVASKWKIELPDTFVTECALDEIDERIDRMLEGRNAGRTVVKVVAGD